MPKVSEMLGIDENWRPSKSDIIQLYSLAREKMWTRNGVHALMEVQFKVMSSKDLNYEQYEKLMGWIGRCPPDSLGVERDANTPDMFDQRPESSM